ncbi:hypothetical protein G3H63_10875 [Microbacterium resistens]|uniref:hypothetical protein n=1 Tax=Microbacterium resistens TaxID=156977 RepID=UPI001C580E84|nr:hypothetical protein [Microbacterium resistens]MBW1639569.1 hypothetical protein [Microbacterium resistens]
MRKVLTAERTAGVTMRKRRRDGADGVQVTDHAEGLEYFVVPVEHDGLPELVRYEVAARNGRPLPLPPSDEYLPHVWLADATWDFLQQGRLRGSRLRVGNEDGVQIAFRGRRPRTHVNDMRQPRPDDEILIQFLERQLLNAQRQPVGEDKITLRHALVDRYGISLRLADSWLNHARTVAPDRVPKSTGRPRKTDIGKEES